MTNVRNCKWCFKQNKIQPTKDYKALKRAFLERGACLCLYQEVQNYDYVCKSLLQRCDFHEQETKTSNTQGFNQSYHSDPGCRDFSTVRTGHRRNQKMLFQGIAVTDSM